MKLKDKYSVGQNLYIVCTQYDSKSHSLKHEIRSQIITAVGRKYVSAGRYDKYRQSNEDIYLTSYDSTYGFNGFIIAFPTEREAQDYIDSIELIDLIRDKLYDLRALVNNGTISAAQLKSVAEILNV